jgi:hypothetical protein
MIPTRISVPNDEYCLFKINICEFMRIYYIRGCVNIKIDKDKAIQNRKYKLF